MCQVTGASALALEDRCPLLRTWSMWMLVSAMSDLKMSEPQEHAVSHEEEHVLGHSSPQNPGIWAAGIRSWGSTQNWA